MRQDLRYVCKGCGYKASRRGDASTINLNCPFCGDRLVKIPHSIKEAKLEKARQEIKELYRDIEPGFQ